MLPPVMHYVGPEIMCKGCRCAYGKSRDYGEDRRKSNCRDESKEEVARKRLRQQRRAHIRAAVCCNEIAPYNSRCAKSQKGGQDVKTAYDYHRPDYADARGLRIRNRIKSD